MVKNPIEKMGMVATPESPEALQAYLAKFSGEQATVALTCAGMAWNLAYELTENYTREILAEIRKGLIEDAVNDRIPFDLSELDLKKYIS